MPLEDPNDPNVQARGKRMRDTMKYMHVLHANALQVALLQNSPLPTDGSLPMNPNYVGTRDTDIVTLSMLEAALIATGFLPEEE